MRIFAALCLIVAASTFPAHAQDWRKCETDQTPRCIVSIAIDGASSHPDLSLQTAFDLGYAVSTVGLPHDPSKLPEPISEYEGRYDAGYAKGLINLEKRTEFWEFYKDRMPQLDELDWANIIYQTHNSEGAEIALAALENVPVHFRSYVSSGLSSQITLKDNPSMAIEVLLANPPKRSSRNLGHYCEYIATWNLVTRGNLDVPEIIRKEIESSSESRTIDMEPIILCFYLNSFHVGVLDFVQRYEDKISVKDQTDYIYMAATAMAADNEEEALLEQVTNGSFNDKQKMLIYSSIAVNHIQNGDIEAADGAIKLAELWRGSTAYILRIMQIDAALKNHQVEKAQAMFEDLKKKWTNIDWDKEPRDRYWKAVELFNKSVKVLDPDWYDDDDPFAEIPKNTSEDDLVQAIPVFARNGALPNALAMTFNLLPERKRLNALLSIQAALSE